MTTAGRVIHVAWEVAPDLVGGLGVHVAELARAEAALGAEVWVAAPESPVSRRTLWHEALPGVRRVAAGHRPNGPSFFADLDRMNAALVEAVWAQVPKRRQGFVIHAHDWLVAPAAVTLADAMDLPLVATFHASERGRRGGAVRSDPASCLIASREHRLAARALIRIAPSRALAHEIEMAGSGQVHVIPNGWPVGQPAKRHVQPSALLFVGRLVLEKGLRVILDVLPALRAQFPALELWVVGEGPERQSLEQCAKRQGLGQCVHFLGQRTAEELVSLRAKAAVAVMPSIYEPFGLAGLEAVAAGVPLVASAVGGLAEWAQGVATLVAPVDRLAWQKAIAKALTQPFVPPPLALRRVTGRHWQWVGRRTLSMYVKAHLRKRRRSHAGERARAHAAASA